MRIPVRSVGASMILAIIGLAVAWMALRSTDVVDDTMARLCEMRYSQAKSATDSAIVDAYRPRITKTGQTELSCGTLRKIAQPQHRP
jgi:hypothetical protein